MNENNGFCVAALLPVRERYARTGAGAVASVVDGFARRSGQREHLKVFGTAVDEPLDGAAFVPVRPAAWWHGSGTRRYLIGAARQAQDTVELLEVHNRPKYVPLLRKLLPRTALALYLHNDPRAMEGMKTPEERRRIGALVQGVICVSDYIRRCFLEGVDELAAKTFVVRNGVDTDVFCPLPEQEKWQEIVFAGRTISDKGPHLLVEAGEKLLPDFPDWKIVIVGGRYFGAGKAEAYEEELFERVRRLGPQGEVTGYLPRNELLERWQRASIAVLPALWEDPISLAVMEAAACGLAVLTTRRGGIPEGIGDAAMYIAEETGDGVAVLLRSLMESPSALRAWQTKARKHAVQHSSLRVLSPLLDDVRREIYASSSF